MVQFTGSTFMSQKKNPERFYYVSVSDDGLVLCQNFKQINIFYAESQGVVKLLKFN